MSLDVRQASLNLLPRLSQELVKGFRGGDVTDINPNSPKLQYPGGWCNLSSP